MARRIFFSFHYEADVGRASIVRNHSVTKGLGDAGYIDAAAWEALRRFGDEAVRRWINQQLQGTTVTVVLIGTETASRQWVRYEIQRSWDRDNGVLGIRIHNIRDFRTRQLASRGADPFQQVGISGVPVYDWVNDDGYNKFASWVEDAANQTHE